MQFGIYAPIPMATVGSPEIAQSAAEALNPLAAEDRDAQLEHSLALLLAADSVGFDLCLFAERHLGNDLSAWILASAVASRLKQIKALVAVHPGLLDPVLTAKMAVSLDRICRGRMALNVVNGWFDEEFRMFGGTVLQGEARYKRASEFITILRGLWSNDTFSFSGDHYQIESGRLLLKPGSGTPPEIYSVSSGDRGRDFIAEYCDWWFIAYPKTAETTDDVMRELEASIRDMNKRAPLYGRKMRYALNPFVALGESEDAAVRATIDRIFAYDPDPDTRKIESRILPTTKAGCIGTPEKVQAQIRRFGDIGIELLLCKMIPTPENIRKIGHEVIMPLRASG
jgi:FMNH2-dependent dimethyl sulfone monooxygenase